MHSVVALTLTLIIFPFTFYNFANFGVSAMNNGSDKQI